MHHLTRAATLCFVLALLAWQQAPVQAEPKEGDWKSGWNTWATVKKGDWAEYAMEGGIKVRYEAVKVDGKKVTYKHATYAKGELTSEKELTKSWESIKLQSKLPYGKDVVIAWSVQDLELSGVPLKCDVAEWTIGEASSAIYFCKDVPCGGVVKTVTNGRDIVWLCGFFKEGGTEVKADPVKEVVSQMPRFYANSGNYLVVKLSGTGRDETYQRRTVSDAAETSAKLTVVVCDKEGTPDAKAKSSESELTKEAWDKDYGKPSEKGVKLTVGAGEYVCDVYKTNADGREVTEWVSDGAMLKKVIKTKTGETVLEAIQLEMK
ncbi:MAG: hypothetical protein H6841_05005 [Planctomycetes bacterium]|nr:hypothetical protein [Planctomycetota bacterium]MCB9934973.1 hypothetical protein [Planctomycetota bacterium]